MILYNEMPILKKISICIFLLGCFQIIYGQKFIKLSVDNDLYFLTDRYYSSGIFISYGYQKNKQIDGIDSLDNSSNIHWHLGQEVYTPARLQTRDLSEIDYPFGGWLFIEREVHKYLNNNTAYAWGVQIGTTGEESLAPWMQNFYHINFLKLPRVTWESAIPQEIHLNLNINMKKRIMIEEKFYFLSDFFSTVGTQKTTIGAQFGFFMGETKRFSFTGNPLESKGDDGLSFYIGSRQEYRFHDYMISGSLFNEKATFTLPSRKYRNSFEFGASFNTDEWEILALISNTSRDNEEQLFFRHTFLNISISKYL
ncbi:MAG: hypothetical protein CMC57_03095 [Flavobacteriaceae bacterium]|nr:hypothetical protein [Flavobacteriaceae bacterium]|tara:strand:- start:89 stop:1021 length:933 start_codon:yes stop_codon:yes gene_type:complete